jgi:hypothetical protein
MTLALRNIVGRTGLETNYRATGRHFIYAEILFLGHRSEVL